MTMLSKAACRAMLGLAAGILALIGWLTFAGPGHAAGSNNCWANDRTFDIPGSPLMRF